MSNDPENMKLNNKALDLSSARLWPGSVRDPWDVLGWPEQLSVEEFLALTTEMERQEDLRELRAQGAELLAEYQAELKVVTRKQRRLSEIVSYLEKVLTYLAVEPASTTNQEQEQAAELEQAQQTRALNPASTASTTAPGLRVAASNLVEPIFIGEYLARKQ